MLQVHSSPAFLGTPSWPLNYQLVTCVSNQVVWYLSLVLFVCLPSTFQTLISRAFLNRRIGLRLKSLHVQAPRFMFGKNILGKWSLTWSESEQKLRTRLKVLGGDSFKLGKGLCPPCSCIPTKYFAYIGPLIFICVLLVG